MQKKGAVTSAALALYANLYLPLSVRKGVFDIVSREVKTMVPTLFNVHTALTA